MKEIKLTQDQIALVDDNWFEYLSQWKWFAHFNKNTNSYYAETNIKIRNKYKTVGMHRLITNAPKNMDVDHINGDTLFNLFSNLRCCSKTQNTQNRKIGNGNTSGYKGVTWYKSSKKWKAQIQINGKKKSLGYFTNIIDAANAYDKTAKELFGEFARLNF